MIRLCVCISLLLSTGLSAVGETPTLTDVQKLQIQNAVQAVELAQLRLQALLASLVPTGYQLNERFELVKVPPVKE